MRVSQGALLEQLKASAHADATKDFEAGAQLHWHVCSLLSSTAASDARESGDCRIGGNPWARQTTGRGPPHISTYCDDPSHGMQLQRPYPRSLRDPQQETRDGRPSPMSTPSCASGCCTKPWQLNLPRIPNPLSGTLYSEGVLYRSCSRDIDIEF